MNDNKSENAQGSQAGQAVRQAIEPSNGGETSAESVSVGQARVADSISAAAGMTEFSENFLEQLKGMGCPAFRGSRVYLDELEKYVEENDLSVLQGKMREVDVLDVEIRREKLRKVRFENEAAEGKFIARADIAGQVMKVGSDLKAELRLQLEDQLPERLEGKPAEEIRAIMRTVVDELCAIFSKGAAQWTA